MSGKAYIFISAAVLLMTGLLSCNKETDAPVVQKVARCAQVNINCSAFPDMKSGAGTAEEQLHSLRIYAFMDGELVSHHCQESAVKTSFLMDFVMEDPGQQSERTIDFYLIANEDAMVMETDMPAIDENLTVEQLNNLRYIAVAPDAGLPMAVRQTYTLDITDLRDMSSLDPSVTAGHEAYNLLEDVLNFDLVRTIGKITVSAAKKSASTPDVYIKSLVMLARGTRHYNYLMPQSEDFLRTLQPRVNDRAVLEENTTYTVTSHDSFEEVATVYCSEVPFGSPSWDVPNNDNSIVLRAEYSLGEGTELRTSYMYLPPMHRNQWIKVNCTVVGEGMISVSYTVNDWEVDEGSDDDYLVFDYPTHSYILPALPTESLPVPDPNPEGGPAVDPLMSMTSPFVGYFQILYPAGQTWTPTIYKVDAGETEAESEDYDIVVHQIEDGNATLVSAPYGLNSGHDSYFRITVTPRESGNDGAKVHLGITTVIQGFGHAEYLLINGSQSEIFWPESGGKDPNILIITQKENE